MKFNPELDLKLERVIDLPVEIIWKAWTNTEIIKKWFCPRPWTVIECEMDLRPGGVFKTIMQSPEGDQIPNVGCILEVNENKKLIWTDALLPGFRPIIQLESGSGLLFTAVILLEPHSHGTKYTAIAIHKDLSDRKKHEEMGFHEGWGIALDQLIEYAKNSML
jgi:uncharacterized protein YndB with AHSA1/START domain